MKKALLLFALALLGFDAAAQYVTPSQLKPTDGYVRRSPCQSGAGDNCGSEPPTWHATPSQCGTIFSTSSARNESYSYDRDSGTGVKTVFSIPFPYLNTSHVEVLVGGVLQTEGVDYTVSAPGSSGTVTFTTPPAAAATVLVRLKTTWDGDGVTVTFPFNFRINYIESLEVKVGGVTKTYSTDYTISGLRSPAGGTVTFTVAPAAGSGNVSIKMIALPTKGVKLTVPTNAELVAAGYKASSASPLAGPTNREGQCRIGFVAAAPAPTNYLRIGLDGGVLGNDKFTNIWEGGPSIDFYDGELVFPEGWGIVWYVWNGTSWVYDGNSGSMGERVSMGQTSSQGQGRLFVVTADPPWWTVGSKVGSLAYCPHNGRGLNTNANDHTTRALMPVNCVFSTPSGSSTDYIQVTQATGSFASDVTQGAAYAAGTSPDGTPYPAGNYVVVVLTGTMSPVATGNTVSVVSLPMTLGTKTTGKWIVKRLTPGVDPGCAGGSPACLELHEEVQDWNQNKVWGIGPPSSFVAGDTRVLAGTNVACCMAHALSTVSLANGRRTDPVMGAELVGSVTAPEGTIVGLARVVGGVYTDSGSTRNVASWFNPIEKKCEFTLSADKTTTSTSFVEVDNTRRCNFVYTDGISTRSKMLGDTGRTVRYIANIGAANNTAANGCEFAIGFDGITPEESTPPGFVNPAGVTGGRQTVTVSGAKSGLTNAAHDMRLLMRAVTGGTCTAFAGSTTVQAWIPQ
ncbi:MAG TPA: phage tail fiber protein [Ramlibacter sp.]|uniref:phage tail fiber domain-containing protein n=1 Tax=Ramlibacter sp. TaxID=1917967 RepID=UPI002D7EFE38|nr:phage tail fiber protein [Ramlibacter sp.]HET8744317.1 phage tail fiber protein [Ramlibacter sp.]